jgi:proteasome accessory factor B
VVSARGRWYLVGYDRDRADVRSFRLSRIDGPVTPLGPPGAVRVPPGTDLLAVVERAVELPPVIGTARLWVAAGRAHGLRRLGRVRGPQRHPDPATGRDGDELEIDLRSVDIVARWVAGYGPDVAVLDPPALAAAVRDVWAGALAAHAGADLVAGDAGPDDRDPHHRDPHDHDPHHLGTTGPAARVAAGER